jgi:hypothetical protein
MSGT